MLDRWPGAEVARRGGAMCRARAEAGGARAEQDTCAMSGRIAAWCQAGVCEHQSAFDLVNVR